MASSDITRIRLSDPAELIAALPALIGFNPVESLVVVCLHRRRVGLTMRVDLPTVRRHWDPLVEQLMPALRQQRPSRVVLAVVAPYGTGTARLPHADLVDHVTDSFTDNGIRVSQAVWAEATAAGASWAAYDELPGIFGAVPDPAASEVAAATVAAGRVLFDDREDLADLLRPDAPDVLHRRGRLLAKRLDDHPYTPQAAQQRFHEMGELLAPARVGLLYLDDERFAVAGSALLDLRVRDACLTWSLGDDADAAERLWIALVRGLPRSHRADPAALLAATAYLRGDGPLAGIALDVAHRAWPEHTFAALLDTALHGGLSPQVLRDALREAEADALLDLGLGEEKAS